MDRILKILKKENGPRASSAPALELNTIIFKYVYWYMQLSQVSVYRTIGPLVVLVLSILFSSFWPFLLPSLLLRRHVTSYTQDVTKNEQVTIPNTPNTPKIIVKLIKKSSWIVNVENFQTLTLTGYLIFK